MQFVLINMSFDIEIFTVEFVKLADGYHEFNFEIDKTFFEYYENSDLVDAHLKVEMDINKTGNMMIADIFTHGNFILPCDRCLTELSIPVEADFKLIYHLNSEHITKTEVINDLDTDIVYLSPLEYKVNVAQAIYESSLMDIPMIKTCDDFNDNSCDQIMLVKINGTSDKSADKPVDPRWEKLKNIFNNEE